MTRAITAIDVMTGGPRGQTVQKRWHYYNWKTTTKGATHVEVSPIYKNGVIVHKLKIEQIQTNRANDGGALMAFCVTNNANLAWADMPNESQIIYFNSILLNNVYEVLFQQHQVEFDLLRRFEGANLRLAIGFQSLTDDDLYINAGILFSEP